MQDCRNNIIIDNNVFKPAFVASTGSNYQAAS